MTGDGEPIFIFPTVLPTDDKDETHPVLMASVCVSKDKCNCSNLRHIFILKSNPMHSVRCGVLRVAHNPFTRAVYCPG